MVGIFEELDRFLEKFDTLGVTNLKIVGRRYIKYKRSGKWHRNEIANFDRYSKHTYKTLEWLAKELFEDVKKVPQKVPVIVNYYGKLQYVPSHTILDNKTLFASKLLPIFLKRGRAVQKNKYTNS